MRLTGSRSCGEWFGPLRCIVQSMTAAVMLTLAAPLASHHAYAEDRDFPVSATIQFDAARSMRLGEGCPHPATASAKRKAGTHIFTLHGGDVGRCPGDGEENYGSPFRERVMIHAIYYPKRGNWYRFSALVRFDPETRSSDSTVLFQVHQNRTPECRCYPVIMIYMMADGTLEAETSSYSETSYRRRKLAGWTRQDFEKGWVEVALDVSTVEGVQTARVFLGGKLVYAEPSLVYEAGATRPQVGLYRPGPRKGKNPTDRVFIKDMRAAEFR